MVHPIYLAPDFAVHAQIGPEDLEQIAAMGFKTVINNRPDGEVAGQPRSADLAREAAARGLNYVEVPVAFPDLTDAQLAEMADAMRGDAPILAFCRTGTRSTILRTIVQARAGVPLDELLQAAFEQGYDLRPQAPLIQRLSQSS
ncbi:MAG: TIGR01244 family sulfur transferase [Pseudomonadota bacterium]|nr:TIGR01244 family sulfur transferase [Pseudomonadota bacterium]